MKYDVLNRFTGEVQFTADIDCDENELTSIKLGLAIQWGYKNKKNLARANMEGAYMARANMDNYPVSFGCVGEEKRTGYAVMENGIIMVRLGCFYDSEEKAYDAIRMKYGDNSIYEALVKAACNQVRFYGKQKGDK